MSYVSLHTHSEYSLLDALPSVDELAAWTAEHGMPAVALTDHGTCAGHYKFAQACERHGVRPIFGLEAYVAPRGAHVKEPDPDRPGKRPIMHHITLLAKDQTGLRNLYTLSSLAYQVGFYYVARIDYDMLFEYHEGIICLSGCIHGGVSQYILSGQLERAIDLMWACYNVFGDDYYLEVQYHGLPEQQRVLSTLYYLGQKFGIPLVVTQDVHYLHPEDWITHRMLLAVRAQDQFIILDNGKPVLNPNPKLSYATNQFWYKTEAEMLRMFPPELHDAIYRTGEVAQKCAAQLEVAPRLWEGEWIS